MYVLKQKQTRSLIIKTCQISILTFKNTDLDFFMRIKRRTLFRKD